MTHAALQVVETDLRSLKTDAAKRSIPLPAFVIDPPLLQLLDSIDVTLAQGQAQKTSTAGVPSRRLPFLDSSCGENEKKDRGYAGQRTNKVLEAVAGPDITLHSVRHAWASCALLDLLKINDDRATQVLKFLGSTLADPNEFLPSDLDYGQSGGLIAKLIGHTNINTALSHYVHIGFVVRHAYLREMFAEDRSLNALKRKFTADVLGVKRLRPDLEMAEHALKAKLTSFRQRYAVLSPTSVRVIEVVVKNLKGRRNPNLSPALQCYEPKSVADQRAKMPTAANPNRAGKAQVGQLANQRRDGSYCVLPVAIPLSPPQVKFLQRIRNKHTQRNGKRYFQFRTLFRKNSVVHSVVNQSTTPLSSTASQSSSSTTLADWPPRDAVDLDLFNALTAVLLRNITDKRLETTLDAWLAQGARDGTLTQALAARLGAKTPAHPNSQTKTSPKPHSEVQHILKRGLVLDRGDRSFTLRLEQGEQLAWITATYKQRGSTPPCTFGGPDATPEESAAIASAMTFACIVRLDNQQAQTLDKGIDVRDIRWGS